MLKIKLCPRNYLEDIYPYAKFHCNIFTGSFPPNMWNITLLWLFCCPVLSSPVLVILFFSQLRPGRTPGWNLTIYGGRSLLESMRNAITRLQINRLGRNFGGRIPSCSQYWKCYNSYYYGTDWDDSWMVASKQHLCCKTVSLVFGRYC